VGDYTGAHTVIFRGIFSIYYSADGTSKAAMGGVWLGAGKGDIIFLGCQIAEKGAMGGTGNIILTTVSSGKLYAPGGPTSGLKGIILFLGDE
jgi:hypothetical protein